MYWEYTQVLQDFFALGFTRAKLISQLMLVTENVKDVFLN